MNRASRLFPVILTAVIGCAALPISAAFAQSSLSQHPPESPITVPPRPYSDTPATTGQDSTIGMYGGSGVVNSSSVTVGSGGGAVPPPPPPAFCNAGMVATQTQTASCPAGQIVLPAGGTTFTQSQSHTETCPSGPFGPIVWTPWTAWSPPASSVCGTPIPTISSPYIRIQACAADATSVNSPNCGYAPTAGYATGIATWNGQSVPFRINCPNERTDACDNSQPITVGGRTFTLQIIGAGRFRGDVYCPPRTRCTGAPGGGWLSVH